MDESGRDETHKKTGPPGGKVPLDTAPNAKNRSKTHRTAALATRLVGDESVAVINH